MNAIPIGNCDCDVDVCFAPDILVADVPIVGVTRQDLRLRWFDRGGHLLATKADVYTGTHDGGAFPRLAFAGQWTWLAHRAVVNNVMQATVRRIWPDRTVTTDADGVLGVADGTLALSGDWVAWHDYHAKAVYGCRLTVPLGPVVRLRDADPSIVGIGLSHMDGDRAVMKNENANSVPGMIDPVADYQLVVGKNTNGGIEVRTGEKKPWGTLLPEEFTNDPRGARDGEAMVAVHWGANARLVLFTTADLQHSGKEED